jgi:hypothetical protein
MDKIKVINIVALYEIIKEKKINILHEEFLKRYQYLKYRNGKEIKCWLMCMTRDEKYWTYKIKINDDQVAYLSGLIEKVDGNRLISRSNYYGGVR